MIEAAAELAIYAVIAGSVLFFLWRMVKRG